ncbi:MAG: hypothetical protein FJ225_09920 [Lentisphaerae bacterium]|nr:hypothetical protein [Lentisphaerota bacterium]
MLAVACGLLLGGGRAYAGAPDLPSTLRLENAAIIPRDDATAAIAFNIAWESSWRHEGNHDAAWVFFKARPEGSTDWQHVRLAADKTMNPTGYRSGSGTPLELFVPDGADGFTGLFVRRAEYGAGKVAATGVTVVWDLTAARGITKDTKVEVRAFGIEMVFIPEGPYVLGGGTATYHFYMYTNDTEQTLPYLVTGPGAIPTGRKPGRLWANRDSQPEDGGEIPAAFPNGYAAIYCMKKPITGVQYADFLNTLPPAQAETLFPPKAPVGRSGTGTDVMYRGTTDADGRLLINGLAWVNGVSFAAWAGLRPMTELEYEKITRGPRMPGWDTDESLDHPSYWLVTNMNGWRNPIERTVTVANATGRGFKGSHGLGTPVLPADWPRADAVGAGIRGGFGISGNPSYRRAAALVDTEATHSWRGVRSAPKGVGL